MRELPLVAIVGPTGSGKSELSLRVCETFGGEVVSCDSLQIYRYFDIGTAKLRPEERRGIPHHMLDIADPAEVFTAGEFANRTRPLLSEIANRALPVVVGGTGLYLRALLDGLFPAPARDAAIRKRLTAREHLRPGSLHRLLRRLDPKGAAAIHPNDMPKLIRALEVYLLTKRPITAWFSDGRASLTGFRAIKIGLAPPREALYDRLNLRCRQMFEAGLVEETRRIMDMGWSSSAKPFESLGYRQALQMLRGEMKFEEALLETRTNTRHYAKRQLTWFRKEPGVQWLEGFGNDPEIQRLALDIVRQSLNS